MREITFGDRVFFGIIAIAALFVSYLGFFDPARMDESFTWAFLPPLHARFVASLYLFGGVYLGGCMIARYRSQISPGPIAVVIFTTLLLLITLWNPKAFDYDLTPPWVWTLSYIVYPLWGIVLAWSWRKRGTTTAPGAPMPDWARVFLLVQAALFGLAGIALLVVPREMVDLWPWPIDKGLAQFYGGPFLAYAFCSWAYSRKETWTEVATIVPAMLAFSGATVIVSLVHRELFSASDLSTWVWFGVFGGVALITAAMCAVLVATRSSGRTAVAGAV